VNVTVGTKGGRGHRVDRWVPVSEPAIAALRRAAAAQGTDRNLIPVAQSWRQWNDHLHHVWSAAAARLGLGKLHNLRAAYACERYAALTGSPAPVCSGRRALERELDRSARATIAAELGHARIDVVTSYIGGTG
jgi:integrase